MTVQALVPDVMGDLRAALRALPDLKTYLASDAQHDNRVFFATPAGAVFPLLRLTEAGIVLNSDLPIPQQRVLIEVIGGAAGDYYNVDAAKRIIIAWVWSLTNTTIGTTTFVNDGAVDTVTDLPDPDDGAPRKVISAVLSVRPQ